MCEWPGCENNKTKKKFCDIHSTVKKDEESKAFWRSEALKAAVKSTQNNIASVVEDEDGHVFIDFCDHPVMIYPAVTVQFHHLIELEKTFNIMDRATLYGYPIFKIIDEAKKCIVLPSDLHSVCTKIQQALKNKRSNWISEIEFFKIAKKIYPRINIKKFQMLTDLIYQGMSKQYDVSSDVIKQGHS